MREGGRTGTTVRTFSVVRDPLRRLRRVLSGRRVFVVGPLEAGYVYAPDRSGSDPAARPVPTIVDRALSLRWEHPPRFEFGIEVFLPTIAILSVGIFPNPAAPGSGGRGGEKGKGERGRDEVEGGEKGSLPPSPPPPSPSPSPSPSPPSPRAEAVRRTYLLLPPLFDFAAAVLEEGVLGLSDGRTVALFPLTFGGSGVVHARRMAAALRLLSVPLLSEEEVVRLHGRALRELGAAFPRAKWLRDYRRRLSSLSSRGKGGGRERGKISPRRVDELLDFISDAISGRPVGAGFGRGDEEKGGGFDYVG